MTVMRLRYEKRGGHYHCAMFTAPAIEQTFAKNGDVVFDEREWPEVRAMLELGGVQVLERGAPS